MRLSGGEEKEAEKRTRVEFPRERAASHQRNYASEPSTAVPNVSNSSAAEFCDFGLRGGENQICLAPFLNAPNEGRDGGRRPAPICLKLGLGGVSEYATHENLKEVGLDRGERSRDRESLQEKLQKE